MMTGEIRIRQAQRIEQLEATLLAFAGFLDGVRVQLSPLARCQADVLLRRSEQLLPGGNPSEVELVAACSDSECDGVCR